MNNCGRADRFAYDIPFVPDSICIAADLKNAAVASIPFGKTYDTGDVVLDQTRGITTRSEATINFPFSNFNYQFKNSQTYDIGDVVLD